jgi:prepilin signal peptidase PulO-like enzyme (type II secretory pathway)
LIFGSFGTALSYRIPRGINFVKGRSFCPKCKEQIRWNDNIPVISYLLLGGRCRVCHNKISLRYPLIEVSIAICFLLIFLVSNSCASLNSPICLWKASLGGAYYPFILLLFLINSLVFVIDLERKIIPDGLVVSAFIIIISTLVLSSPDRLYLNLVSAFSSAFFLLSIHLFTGGRGMGLGDVKFAIIPGLFLGWPLSVVWLFVAFLTGGIVAIILIVLGHSKGKDKIAFGPFLALAFLIVSLFGDSILRWII